MVKVTRPALRYHGGKWRLAPWVISHFPAHRRYIEPFGGAASVLLRKPRAFTEVYNDLDSDVVNLFRVARDRGEELARALELTPFSREEYYAAMELAGDPLEDARRLVIRSFMGFGSDSHTTARRCGFRATLERVRARTPARDWANYPDALRKTIERLTGVVIENKPAVELIERWDAPDTLFYCDPPYVHGTRMMNSHSKKRYTQEMSDDDHRALAAVLGRAGAMIILSGYRCELYEELYEDWRRTDRKTFAAGARPRVESLWMNAAAVRATGTLFAGVS